MKSEAILSGASLNEISFRDVAPQEPGTRASHRNLWQRVLVLFERAVRLSSRAPRRLRLCESLPLGERRFVAVVEFESARFLVGGTSASLVLLARLQDAGPEVDLPQKALTEASRGVSR